MPQSSRLPHTRRPRAALPVAGALVLLNLLPPARLRAEEPQWSTTAFADVAAATQSAAPEKSGYTLINPVPVSQLREFNTGRPDVTESPFTVDPGHYQLELSFAEYTHDHGDDARADGLSILPFNVRVGLSSNVEVDLMADPFLNFLEHGRGFSDRASGFGDTTLRSKINFWGNDGGNTAGGIIPFIALPTGTGGVSDHHVQGGIILPFAMNLPGGFDPGTMAEFDIDRNDADTDYGVDFVHTVTLGHPLWTDKLAAYVEYVGVSPFHTGHSYLAYFDTGLTWMLAANLQLDTGINIGLSDRADNYTLFTGLSVRF